MIRTRQRLSAIATGAVLALVLAGAATASAQTYPNHKPVRGDYPGTYTSDASIWVATQRHAAHQPLSRADYAPVEYPAYPTPKVSATAVADVAYPNHKPVSGDYPGTYASSAPTSAAAAGDAFDWADAGIGAGAMLGLVLLFGAAKASTVRARQRFAA